MNNRNKLIELLIYIAIVVVGVVLLLTEPERAVENMDMGGTSYAAVLDE